MTRRKNIIYYWKLIIEENAQQAIHSNSPMNFKIYWKDTFLFKDLTSSKSPTANLLLFSLSNSKPSLQEIRGKRKFKILETIDDEMLSRYKSKVEGLPIMQT